jgi:hypothetical protein
MTSERETLLFGIAQFLDEEVRPQIKDPRANFRVLIAAHLARSIGGELVVEEERTRAAIARLEGLVGEPAATPKARADEVARLRALTQKVADDVKSGAAKGDRLEAIKKHVMQSLEDELRITSPRFSTAREIE